jgi:hypothetical protein
MAQLCDEGSQIKTSQTKKMSAPSARILQSTAALRGLLREIRWPEMQVLVHPNSQTLEAMRPVRANSESEIGSFFSQKLKRSVQCESLLERKFFRLLEESTDVLWYLEQPLRVRYLTDKEPKIYVPDVLVALRNHQFVVVEVKPVAGMLAHYRSDKYSALRGHCGGVGWGVLLTDGSFSFEELSLHRLPPDYAGAMRTRLSAGEIFEPEYREIAARCGANQKDFAALILQDGIEHTIRPFRLAYSSEPRTLLRKSWKPLV